MRNLRKYRKNKARRWHVLAMALICILMFTATAYGRIVDDPVDAGGGGQPTAGLLPLPSQAVYQEETPEPEPTEQSPAEPTPGPTSEPTKQPSPAPAEQSETKPTPVPTVEPAAEPVTEPVIEPVTEPSADPTTIPTEDPIESLIADPISDPEPQHSQEPSTDPDPTELPDTEPIPVPEGALAVEDKEQGVVFFVEESLQNAEVGENYTPMIDLQNLRPESVVTVQRNGEYIPYSLEDGRLTISSEDVEDGKNRITVTVTDPDGTVTQMEPWEFYRGDLYEKTPYAIIGGQGIKTGEDNNAQQEGENDMKKKKKQKHRITFFVVLAAMLTALVLLGIGVYKLISSGEESAASEAAAPTVALTDVSEQETGPVEVSPEPTAEPTAAPTATPTPTPTPSPTPTPEPNPRAGIKIAIDPGHQAHGNFEQEPIGPGASTTKAKVASGTSGHASGLNEYELTLDVSLQLRDELVKRGYQVYMIRETHDVNISNKERAEAAARENANILVRVHANGSENTGIDGALMYEPSSANPFLTPEVITESQRLSEVMLKAFIEATQATDRGIISGDDMSGINWSTIPVTIVEMGFMSNPEEDLKMASPEYQLKMVEGMANGIDDYFSIKRPDPAAAGSAAASITDSTTSGAEGSAAANTADSTTSGTEGSAAANITDSTAVGTEGSAAAGAVDSTTNGTADSSGESADQNSAESAAQSAG